MISSRTGPSATTSRTRSPWGLEVGRWELKIVAALNDEPFGCTTWPMPTDLRYPVGEFTMPATVTAEMRAQAIAAIASLPSKMRDAVRGLSDAQLDTPYRPGGWTVRQV